MKSFMFLKERPSLLNNHQVTTKLVSLSNLLSPLSQITTKGALEDLLKAGAPRFRRLRAELEELLWATDGDVKVQSEKVYKDMREVTVAKANLLGEEGLEQLLGAIDSLEAFNNWMNETSEHGSKAIYALSAMNQLVGHSPLYAEMCIESLIGVLTDHFGYWVPEALPVLAKAADDYMTEVEDVFLGQSAAMGESEETVDFESLRTELGL